MFALALGDLSRDDSKAIGLTMGLRVTGLGAEIALLNTPLWRGLASEKTLNIHN